MKAITIWQPWASLIAHRYKRFETRGWKTNYRGPIAIHAAKKIDGQAVLMVARDYPEIWHKISPLPTGCVVAVAELKDCFVVRRDHIGGLVMLHSKNRRTHFETKQNEFKFGDYSEGRYAWGMFEVWQIDPVPAKGQQGIWNWEG